MAILPNGELLIGGHKWQRHPRIAPPGQGLGLIPRDYAAYPRGCYPGIDAVDFPTIDQSEWKARLADKVGGHARLSDIKRAVGVPILDQNGRGYCWAHSTTGAVQC